MPGVAGGVPAVADRLRVGVGPVPVPRERLVRAELHLDLAVAAEPEPRVDRRAPRAAGLAQLVAPDREGVDLGRPVVVHEDVGLEDLGAAADERRRHRGARVPERADGRDVAPAELGVVDEVVEERRGEVERRDPLALDEPERLASVPPRLRDEAPADEVHRDEGVDPHRVVERHHAERPVAEAVAVLERLRPAAGPVCRVAARHALRPAGRPRRVEQQRDLALVAVERAGVLVAVRQRVAVAEHDTRAAVLEAVAELLLREPPRERDDHGAAPLRRPVEERGLEPVVEDDGDPLARLDREPAGQPAHAGQELAVGEPGERLELRMALARGEQGACEVHAGSRARVDVAHASIASTIGA